MTNNINEKDILDDLEVERRLENLEGDWYEEEGKLLIEIELNNFEEIMNLVNDIADIAEQLNHHPNLYIHDYNVLDIEVYTHSEDAITTFDFDLANKIDKLL